MSVPNRRIRRRRSEKSSLQILEEAFHLLRKVDLKYYWWFYFGTVPFALAMLYFVADMSRSSFAKEDVFGVSLVLVGFYFWMRVCQKKFCEGLWDTLSPGQLPKRSRVEKVRAMSAYLFLQSLNLPFLAVGLVFAIPLGWIVAMLQNFTVLSGTQDLGKGAMRSLLSSSLRNSHYDWAQNHGILLVFCFVAFFTWINLVATCLILPGFAKSFFGVESIFTVSPVAAMMNTTFLLGSFLLTYLVISPMMKSAYVLRCFYAESRQTGADLLSRLAACRDRRRLEESSRQTPAASKAAVMVICGLFLWSVSASPVFAKETTTVPGAAVSGPVSSDQLRESIGETMEQKKYQWKLSRRILEGESDAEKTWLARQINGIAESARQAFKDFGDWLERTLEKLSRQEQRKTNRKEDLDISFFDELSSTMSIGLIVLVFALVAWVGLLVYRKYRGTKSLAVDEAGEVVAIDLQSDDIVASQLPEEEWMRLAREQMSKGDKRLAVRALFLATLANLGEEGLLKIAKFKSNRDYRNELEMRSRKSVELRSSFDTNTRLFERAWYGWHPVEEKDVETFLKHHEVIARESAKWVSRSSSTPVASH